MNIPYNVFCFLFFSVKLLRGINTLKKISDGHICPEAGAKRCNLSVVGLFDKKNLPSEIRFLD